MQNWSLEKAAAVVIDLFATNQMLRMDLFFLVAAGHSVVHICSHLDSFYSITTLFCSSKRVQGLKESSGFVANSMTAKANTSRRIHQTKSFKFATVVCPMTEDICHVYAVI